MRKSTAFFIGTAVFAFALAAAADDKAASITPLSDVEMCKKFSYQDMVIDCILRVKNAAFMPEALGACYKYSFYTDAANGQSQVSAQRKGFDCINIVKNKTFAAPG